MTQRQEHGGNIRKMRSLTDNTLLDFSANINPLGAPEWVRPVISRAVEDLAHYPDPENLELRRCIAEHHQIKSEQVVAGNGTAELMYNLLQHIPCRRIVIPVPSYIDYYHAAEQSGKPLLPYLLEPGKNFQLKCIEFGQQLRHGDLVILGRPNNPSGIAPASKELQQLIAASPHVWFCIDEAFLDFMADEQSLAGKFANVVTLNSLTKFYALPGLRLGYCTCPPEMATSLRNALPPWRVNSLAQIVGEKLFSDHEFRNKSITNMQVLRRDLYRELKDIPQLHVYPSEVNFHLCALPNKDISQELLKKLLKRGIALRNCGNFLGLDQRYIRIAVRSEDENSKLLEALHRELGGKRRNTVPQKTPAIMFQGTCSNAGKSILSAAFCRILQQDGIKVAPFKAQNMSLNSYVTADGGEMGRAQVVQAQAAGLIAHTDMNPILLKPNSDIGSQVIIQGQAVGNMNVREYHHYKEHAWLKVQESYDRLAHEHEAIILEGAGSPGEINLKKHDIVNMRMGQYAQAPVLIVGDIDRGGVYASFVGIMEVLAQWERDLVAGFMVNRFRGDASLLAPAHDFIFQQSGRRVLGTIPYIEQLGLPEEDSVSFKLGEVDNEKPTGEHITISVISPPHISNFTDVEPFFGEPDVELRIVSKPKDLTGSDAIIIPGSKNVLGDLAWLRDQGFVQPIKQLQQAGGTIIGICGGYQILGDSIADPYAIESTAGMAPGLGLLRLTTTIEREKQLQQRQGYHLQSNTAVTGYEIHHGSSNATSENALFSFSDGSFCGVQEGAVWGAYLHGLFDADDFRRHTIDTIRESKGLVRLNSPQHRYGLQAALDRLAQTVRENSEMDEIYKLMGI